MLPRSSLLEFPLLGKTFHILFNLSLLTIFKVHHQVAVASTNDGKSNSISIRHRICKQLWSIGAAVGSRIFNSKYAPHYATSFGIAMGMIGLASTMNLVTWGFMYSIDNETRKLKRVRVYAAKANEMVLDDVDIHADEKPKGESEIDER